MDAPGPAKPVQESQPVSCEVSASSQPKLEVRPSAAPRDTLRAPEVAMTQELQQLGLIEKTEMQVIPNQNLILHPLPAIHLTGFEHLQEIVNKFSNAISKERRSRTSTYEPDVYLAGDVNHILVETAYFEEAVASALSALGQQPRDLKDSISNIVQTRTRQRDNVIDLVIFSIGIPNSELDAVVKALPYKGTLHTSSNQRYYEFHIQEADQLVRIRLASGYNSLNTGENHVLLVSFKPDSSGKHRVVATQGGCRAVLHLLCRNHEPPPNCGYTGNPQIFIQGIRECVFNGKRILNEEDIVVLAKNLLRPPTHPQTLIDIETDGDRKVALTFAACQILYQALGFGSKHPDCFSDSECDQLRNWIEELQQSRTYGPFRHPIFTVLNESGLSFDHLETALSMMAPLYLNQPWLGTSAELTYHNGQEFVRLRLETGADALCLLLPFPAGKEFETRLKSLLKSPGELARWPAVIMGGGVTTTEHVITWYFKALASSQIVKVRGIAIRFHEAIQTESVLLGFLQGLSVFDNSQALTHFLKCREQLTPEGQLAGLVTICNRARDQDPASSLPVTTRAQELFAIASGLLEQNVAIKDDCTVQALTWLAEPAQPDDQAKLSLATAYPKAIQSIDSFLLLKSSSTKVLDKTFDRLLDEFEALAKQNYDVGSMESYRQALRTILSPSTDDNYDEENLSRCNRLLNCLPIESRFQLRSPEVPQNIAPILFFCEAVLNAPLKDRSAAQEKYFNNVYNLLDSIASNPANHLWKAHEASLARLVEKFTLTIFAKGLPLEGPAEQLVNAWRKRLFTMEQSDAWYIFFNPTSYMPNPGRVRDAIALMNKGDSPRLLLRAIDTLRHAAGAANATAKGLVKERVSCYRSLLECCKRWPIQKVNLKCSTFQLLGLYSTCPSLDLVVDTVQTAVDILTGEYPEESLEHLTLRRLLGIQAITCILAKAPDKTLKQYQKAIARLNFKCIIPAYRYLTEHFAVVAPSQNFLVFIQRFARCNIRGLQVIACDLYDALIEDLTKEGFLDHVKTVIQEADSIELEKDLKICRPKGGPSIVGK